MPKSSFWDKGNNKIDSLSMGRFFLQDGGGDVATFSPFGDNQELVDPENIDDGELRF